jgi:hypothetical protein
MATTWITQEETARPKAAPEPWRKGARALARRFGTTGLRAVQDPKNPERWAVTDSYGLRFFGPDTIEGQALTAYHEAEPIREPGRLVVWVWRSGKNVMAPDTARAIGWDSVARIIGQVEAPHDHDTGVPITPVQAVGIDYTADTSKDPIVQALDADGQRLALFRRSLLGGLLDPTETLWVATPLKPAAVRNADGELLGIIMPIRDSNL